MCFTRRLQNLSPAEDPLQDAMALFSDSPISAALHRCVEPEEVCQHHFWNNAYDILEEKIT